MMNNSRGRALSASKFQRSKLSAYNGCRWKSFGCRGRPDVEGRQRGTAATTAGGGLAQWQQLQGTDWHGGSSCRGRIDTKTAAVGGGLARWQQLWGANWHDGNSYRGRTKVGREGFGFPDLRFVANQQIEYIYPLKRHCFDVV